MHCGCDEALWKLTDLATVDYGAEGYSRLPGLHTVHEIEMQRTRSEAAVSSPKGKCQNTTNLLELLHWGGVICLTTLCCSFYVMLHNFRLANG